MTHPVGVAGRLAETFIHSKLTPLFIAASIALGAFAVAVLPREEEPQIIVPMIDVFVETPGATSAEVEQRVTRPMEKLLWEVPGVEYLYSTSSPGQSMVVVRFYVGEDEERALVRLNQKLAANMDRVPPGVTSPLVKARSIDDVPVVAVTLWGARYDDHQLRAAAAQIRESLAEVPDVSEVTIIGGRPREVRVDVDPSRLAAAGLDPVRVARAVETANSRVTTSGAVRDGRVARLQAGTYIDRVDTLRDVVVSAAGSRAVLLRDVAAVTDGSAEPTSYVRFHSRTRRGTPAVTVSVAKRKGANAITVARMVEQKLDALRGVVLPRDLNLSLTRNYGETAAEKSNELLYHMFLAVLSVSILIASFSEAAKPWSSSWRFQSRSRSRSSPSYLYGYTLNRITLFALIFSIGILVDDAIVVVENVVRHARAQTGEQSGLAALAVRAVDEVGNPTILATLTVVAAILPMAFVGGLMGPYMRPIPVGASAAMLFSLAAAFIVTPWAAVRLLRMGHGHRHQTEDVVTRMYRRAMGRLIASGRARLLFLGGVAMLLLAAMALVPLKLVTVKMLPFDNKSEFQVVIDLPEGTALEQTSRVAAALAGEVLKDPAVTDVQSYVGTAAPYNFNGLVRHYFLRRAPHLADLQVNLLPKDGRGEQSHVVAKRVRERLVPVAAKFNATIQVSEVPPGPPVLQTLVAEVYGPDPTRRIELADQVKAVFQQTPGVVDVDWYVESPQAKTSVTVDQDRASAAGVSAADVAAAVRMASEGARVGLLHDQAAREDVPIVVRLPRNARGSLDSLRQLRLSGAHSVALGELTREASTTEDVSLYHKNLRPVTYVTGDLAGESGEPGVRDSSDERGARAHHAAGTIRLRSLQYAAAARQHEVRDEMGRGVAHHLRGLSRPRVGVRSRAGADLRPGRLVVPGVWGAIDHHGRHPLLARRHPAGPCRNGRVLHGHVDDRLHRRRWHRGTQFDHPGRFHRDARA